MQEPQAATPEQQALDAVAQKIKDDQLLKYQQEQWVDFCAVGGMITRADGEIEVLTIGQFAKSMRVDRTTLYRWRNSIPNFWDKVEARRREIFSRDRTTKVWNGVFLRAAKGDAEQAKIWLSAHAKWQPPSQKHEVSVSGLGDLVNLARKKKIIEGTVIAPVVSIPPEAPSA